LCINILAHIAGARDAIARLQLANAFALRVRGKRWYAVAFAPDVGARSTEEIAFALRVRGPHWRELVPAPSAQRRPHVMCNRGDSFKQFAPSLGL
jgi:hypothetical protein